MREAYILVTKIYEGAEAERRLLELGPSMQTLEEIILKGEYARAEHTQHDPVNAGGIDAYRYRVRGLRDALVPFNWTIDRTGSLEGTRSPDGMHNILTRAGNEDVGRREGFPQPSSHVGDSTRDAVGNGAMFLDPNWLNTPATKIANDSTTTTWLLLVYRDVDIVRAELSSLNELDGAGQVKAWTERILVPDINMSDLSARIDETPIPVDVPLPRKR